MHSPLSSIRIGLLLECLSFCININNTNYNRKYCITVSEDKMRPDIADCLQTNCIIYFQDPATKVVDGGSTFIPGQSAATIVRGHPKEGGLG